MDRMPLIGMIASLLYHHRLINGTFPLAVLLPDKSRSSDQKKGEQCHKYRTLEFMNELFPTLDASLLPPNRSEVASLGDTDRRSTQK